MFGSFEKYKPMFSNRKAADDALFEFMDIIEERGLTAYLYEGVCLGFVRNGSYIAFDNDIDIIVSAPRNLAWVETWNIFLSHGFKGNNAYESMEGGWLIKNNIMLDVGRVDELTCPLEKVTYKGREFNVPSPVEEYLEGLYGKKWRVLPYESDKKYGTYVRYGRFLHQKRLHERVDAIKNSDGIIGYSFVVGDLLHVGHLQCLELCKTQCDYLIVGVLTDKAVESYKRKPVIPFKERLRLVEALECVDFAVKQPSRDPTSTLKRLTKQGYKVSLLMHADDWNEIPGEKYIKSIGGHLVCTPYFWDLPTTTGIIEKIREEPK